MEKIIIHNKTNLPRKIAVEKVAYFCRQYNDDMPAFVEYSDHIKIQHYKQKTCDTFYVYE